MATVAELRATAKAKGLKGYNKLNKQQLEGLIIRHNLEMQNAQPEASAQKTTPATEQQTQQEAQKPKNADEAQELLKSAETAEQITAILQNCTKHILWKLADRECIHYEDFSKAPIYITKPEMIRDMTKIFVKRLNAIHAEKECKIRIHAANRPYITFNGSTRLINAWSLNYLDSKRKSTPEQTSAFLAFVEKLETKHKATKAEASASTPEAFKINPDLAPDFDAAFDECAYTPNYQPNRAVLDDEPQSRRLIIRRRTAPTARKLPTPKNTRGFVCNFSECKDPEKLRKMLNGGSINVVRAIAESFNEFQPRNDGKTMTKSDYVTAIIRLYFPDYQPKKTAQEVKRDCMGREIIQCGSKFIPGKFYVAGSANYRNEPNPEPEFIKVIKRKNDTITVQVVSYPDFQPVFKPVSKKVKQFHYYYKGKTLALYESITLPNSHDYEGESIHIASLCEYNAMFITTPSYDVDFDETAYSPDVQEVSVIVDDIPADHEPETTDQTKVSAPETNIQPAPSEPERQQEIIARRQHKAKAEARRNTPKPATRKPRHAKKIDESRQVFIQFDEPETHSPASTPAKPKVRRTRKPRVKKDYSRQILIDFGENIPDGQTNQRKAA